MESRIQAKANRLVANRPLAAGFLTGNLTQNNHTGTRFDDSNPLGKAAQRLFSAEDLHAAMSDFNEEAKTHGLKPGEIAIRWIMHHSALGDGDGVILGASKTEQVQETVAMIRKGPLPKPVVQIVEELWQKVAVSRGEIL